MRLRLKAIQDSVESVRTRNAEIECRNRVLVDRWSKFNSHLSEARERFGNEVADFFTNNNDVNLLLLDLDDHQQESYDYLKEIENLK